MSKRSIIRIGKPLETMKKNYCFRVIWFSSKLKKMRKIQINLTVLKKE